MADNDNDRIAAKAHELWEAEGRPHGRDKEHWDEAKEIIALQDSEASTLLPATTGVDEPVEEKTVSLDNEGEAPGLTDTGEHDLTSTSREPDVVVPKTANATPAKAMPKKASFGDASKTERAPRAKPAAAARRKKA